MEFEKNLYEQLGKVTVFYSELEEALEYLLSALLNQPLKVAAIILHRRPISNSTNIIEALFKEKIIDTNLQSPMDKWLQGMRDCINKRNLYVHSTWSIRDPEFTIRSKSKINKKGFKSDWSWARPSEIEELANSIEGIITSELHGILLEMEEKGLTDFADLPLDY